MNFVMTVGGKPGRKYVEPVQFPLPSFKMTDEIPGLVKRYSFGDERDDKDQIAYQHPYGNGCPTEFSYDNQEVLASYIPQNKQRIVIVEIGVCRNQYNLTSTGILIDNKRPQDIYIGIDIDDKSFLNNPDKNVYTLRCPSQDFEQKVKPFLKSLGVEEIDFLMIDGWHSINQVYLEWKYYTSILSNTGIVCFHDTNSHPGPCCVLDSIDLTRYRVYKYCDDLSDWGISVAIKR